MITGVSGFSDEERAILEAITTNRRAWVSGLSGFVVDQLALRGFIVIWATDLHGHELSGGPYLTLTPWGASYLGVELRERRWVKWVHGSDHIERVLVEEPYWAQASHPLRRSVVLPPQARQCGLDYPELILDSGSGLGLEYLTDEDGEPITFFGSYLARIDHRLRVH